MGDGGVLHESGGFTPWSGLSTVEQSLVRGGLLRQCAAGIIQSHGMALRWAGASNAPLAGGYARSDQRELVPQFAAAAAGLIARGVLGLRCGSGGPARDSDQAVTRADLGRVLRDPTTWIWDAREPGGYRLDVSESAHEHWYQAAFFSMARTDYPGWGDLSELQRAILVSAVEASGMLTGPFGIWSQPDPALTVTQRLAAVDDLLAPLLPLVRDGLLEVQYRADARSDAYAVVPLGELRSAFNGTEIWRDDADADFFEGAHAVFTFAGYATWHKPHPSG